MNPQAATALAWFTGAGPDASDWLDFVAGILALVLAVISIYSWRSRRLRGQLLVALAFVAFFAVTIVQIQPGESLLSDAVAAALEIAFLLLFFVALLFPARAPVDGSASHAEPGERPARAS